MAGQLTPRTTGAPTSGDQIRRWDEVLGHIAAAVPGGAASVLVDGIEGGTRAVAERVLAPT